LALSVVLRSPQIRAKHLLSEQFRVEGPHGTLLAMAGRQQTQEVPMENA
jgi:hypothetical protein